MNKLVKVIKRTGVLKVETGLQINGPDVGIGPGGLDSRVTRNPLKNEIYIPGSSVKGKMRASLEQVTGKGKNGDPCGCGDSNCIICTMFGAHKNTRSNAGTPRLIVRDMNLTDEFKGVREVTEVKASTSINREKGTAANGSLRQVERISSGVEFNYEFVLQIYEGDNEKKLKDTLDKGMILIETTGLGGGSTRGNGKVVFLSKNDEEVVF